MLKRCTKIVSLLVAIISTATTISARGAEYQEVETQNGKIESAKAEGNGVFIIEGYPNDEETAIYYTIDGDHFNEIEDLDSGNIGDKLEGQYVEIDNDTYIDTKNSYKKVDDSIREQLVNDAAKLVRKKIKKDNDGKLDENFYDNTVNAELVNGGPGTFFTAGFTQQWSRYKYKLAKAKANGDEYTSIYSDLTGNYIDADYNLGSFKVSTTGSSVTIKNTDDSYKIKYDNGTWEVKAVVEDAGFKSEAYVDMYRLINVSIWGRPEGSTGSYTNITENIKFGDNNKHKQVVNSGAVTAMQVFSKERSSDDADGIKYNKTSKIYFLTDEDGNDFTNDSDCLFMTAYNPTTGAYGGFTTSANGITSLYWDQTNKKLKAQAVKLKSKNGYNYLDLGDVEDIDCDAIDYPGGDLVALSDGYVKLWNPQQEEFVKKYKVDGALDRFNVADMDNIILWDSNSDGETYSIIYNKPKTEDKTGASEGTLSTGNSMQAGWTKNTDGTWTYVKTDKTKATGWLKDAGTWYYLKADGIMATGWVNDNGTWYYLKSSGAMQAGWINDNGTWYYCDASGAMCANTTVDGYVLGADGAWIK